MTERLPTDPSMTAERLLGPNPNLRAEFKGIRETMDESGLPFSLTETNSCCQGGKQGVSETFAAALWGADLMYQLASAGGAGINFHGGSCGWCSPIVGTREAGFLARPLYDGMLLFAQAGPGRLVETTLEPLEQAPLLTAHALRAIDGEIKAAAFNKHLDRSVRLTVEAGERAVAVRLIAPRIDDTTDTTFAAAPAGDGGQWSPARNDPLGTEKGIATIELTPASAALIAFESE